MRQLELPLHGPQQPELYRECLKFADKLRANGLIGGELNHCLGIAIWAFNNPPDKKKETQLFEQYFNRWG